MPEPDLAPDGWPAGASERYVRDCNCDWCSALADALETARAGVARDGEHRSLAAYAGGEPADD